MNQNIKNLTAVLTYYDKGIEAYPDKEKLPRAVLSLSKGEDELSAYMSKAVDACNETVLKK